MTYPGVKETVADFKTATGEDLDGFGAITLDATNLLLEGIKAVGTDKEKLREWLATHKGFVGVAGPIEFDANNDNMRRIIVVKPDRWCLCSGRRTGSRGLLRQIIIDSSSLAYP